LWQYELISDIYASGKQSIVQIKFTTVIRVFVVVFAWSFCCYNYYRKFDHQHFFDFLPGVLIIIASIVSVVSLLFDYAHYLQTKTIRSFFPTLITIICVGCYLGLKEHLLRQDRTAVIFCAYANKGIQSTLSIDFREDGTFKCGQSGFMSGTDFIRGRYYIKDSVIYLNRSNLHGMVNTDKLLMKAMMVARRKRERSLLKSVFGKPRYDTLPETLLLQLNARGDTIPNALRLTVF
jgi:hypothetical protein